MQWFALFFALVVATSVKGSLSVIGEIEDSPYVNAKDDLSSFFQTAEVPNKHESNIVKRMTVSAYWPDRIGRVEVSDRAVISRSEVEKLTVNTDILEILGLENEVYFNGSMLKKIVGFRQDTSFAGLRETRDHHSTGPGLGGHGGPMGDELKNAGKKMCYCHAINLEDDSDSGDEEGEDSDDIPSTGMHSDDPESVGFGETDGVAFYAVLWVGGPKTSYDPHNDQYTKDPHHGAVIYNPGKEKHDTRICQEGLSTKVDDDMGRPTRQFMGPTNRGCLDCCEAAMFHELTEFAQPLINPKFYGPEGCPVQTVLDTCEYEILEDSTSSFHFHLRELEGLKMFSVFTRSNDVEGYCAEFNKASPVDREEGLGPLSKASCLDRARSYERLAGGELEFMNSHDLALKACHIDGFCGGEIQMRAAWPRFSGDGCHECLARSNLAATDLSIMTRNEMDTSRFCDVQNTVHETYFSKPMSKNECANVVNRFHENSGHITRTTVDACSNTCSYSSMKPMNVGGRTQTFGKVKDIQDADFWTHLDI